MKLELLIETLQAMTEDEYRDGLETFARFLEADLEHGICKHCFVFYHEDYVVKFASPGRTRYHGSCQEEVDSYQTAKDYGIEKILLETSFLCRNEEIGVDFYIQPKIDEIVANSSYKTRKRLAKINRTVKAEIVTKVLEGLYSDDIDSIWLESMISLYGKKFAKSFEQWTQEQSVNDLHNWNIGYKKGKPVIFDYAGF